MIALLSSNLAARKNVIQLIGNGTVGALVGSWREHHVQDAKVSHMMAFGLFKFASDHSTKLRELDVV